MTSQAAAADRYLLQG